MERISSISGTGLHTPRYVVRGLEILPGLLTWMTLILPFVLSIYLPVVVAVFIIAFDIYWLLKSIRMSTALVVGYRKLGKAMRTNWTQQLSFLEAGSGGKALIKSAIQEKLQNSPNKPWLLTHDGRLWQEGYSGLLKAQLDLTDYLRRANRPKPSELYQLVILATYNETLETLRPSLEAISNSNYDSKQIIFVLAYEERGGSVMEERIEVLTSEYKDKFGHFYAIKHPDGIVGEHKGKGANISFAARQVLVDLNKRKIPYKNVIVTTLDSDHRPDPNYFAALSYAYLTNDDVIHTSFQPVPMFYNNIWDAPAPMRVIATSNSFWVIINSVRPQFLRNFAAHAQPLESLIDTDFWSVSSPVEDGHQYWRTFFRYGGRHHVQPIFVPVYQDATLSKSYVSSFKNQYLQLQRWAYGVSDIPYVIIQSFRHPEIPFGKRWIQSWRLFEGHYTWATAPLILSFVAWLPLYLNSTFKYSVLAHQLPIIASQIMTLSMMGLFVTIWISLISLPPRPKHYSWFKNIAMILQWILVPVIAIVFGAAAAIDAQTRLMLGKYLVFRVTEKAVKQR